MAELKIINQMFIDDDGNHMTRCWNITKRDKKLVQVMSVIPTDESQIRKPRAVALAPLELRFK